MVASRFFVDLSEALWSGPPDFVVASPGRFGLDLPFFVVGFSGALLSRFLFWFFVVGALCARGWLRAESSDFCCDRLGIAKN